MSNKTKILITGSDGFLGSHICPSLESDYELYPLKSNLLNHKEVNDEIKRIDPNIVVHLAARTEVQDSFNEQITFSEVNYVGTVNLIESIVEHCTDFDNFVFASTMEVYGWQPISDEIELHGEPIDIVAFDENTQPNPNAPYAEAKYGCEKYLEYANRAYGFPYTSLRQTNSYGRKDNDFFVTEQIITQMLKNSDVINLGYAMPYRNFIYVDDMVDVWNTVIGNPSKVKNNTYTIGPNNPIQMKAYADLIADRINWTGKINWDSAGKQRKGEIYWLNSNHDLITKHTGWKPKVALSAGLDKTINTWREIINNQSIKSGQSNEV
jgi:nucleoside-diphosphate-sugar epimerase